MKKLFLILMIVCLLASVVSCGQKPDDEKPKVTENATSQNTEMQEDETPNPTEASDSKIELDANEQIQSYIDGAYRHVYFNYCSKKHRSDYDGLSNIFHASGIDFIALTFYSEKKTYMGNFDGTFSNVFDFLNNGYSFESIERYTFGKKFDKNIKIVPSSRVTTKIKDMDAEQFEGTAGENAENYVYGYTFICDKVPCMLIGIIVDQDEHQDLKAELKEEIDLMVQTIRTELFED